MWKYSKVWKFTALLCTAAVYCHHIYSPRRFSKELKCPTLPLRICMIHVEAIKAVKQKRIQRLWTDISEAHKSFHIMQIFLTMPSVRLVLVYAMPICSCTSGKYLYMLLINMVCPRTIFKLFASSRSLLQELNTTSPGTITEVWRGIKRDIHNVEWGRALPVVRQNQCFNTRRQVLLHYL